MAIVDDRVFSTKGMDIDLLIDAHPLSSQIRNVQRSSWRASTKLRNALEQLPGLGDLVVLLADRVNDRAIASQESWAVHASSDIEKLVQAFTDNPHKDNKAIAAYLLGNHPGRVNPEALRKYIED